MVKHIQKKNIRRQILSQIDNLTQNNCAGCKLEHVDYCKSKCSIGIQLFQLGEKLNSSTNKADTIEMLLSKGKDMKKADIEKLLSLEVNRMKIQKALKLSGFDFSILLKNLGIDKGSVKEVTKIKMTLEEYIKWRFIDGLSHKDIASKFNAGDTTLHYWIKKRADEIEEKKKELGITDNNESEEAEQTLVDRNFDAIVKDLSIKLENKIAENQEINKTLQELETKIKSLENELKNKDKPKQVNDSTKELQEMECKLVECYQVIENTEHKLSFANESLRKYTDENKAMRGLLRLWI